MIDTFTVAPRATRFSARALVLAGTAIGCSVAMPEQASAQAAGNVTYNGPGPFTLTRTTPVNGGPRAIDVTVTSDDATVDTTATTVTTTNNGDTQGAGIAVSNTGPGATTIRNGQVTATGGGTTFAVDGRANAGTITIVNNGVVNTSGNNSNRAINASGGGGDINVTSNEATGQLRGISTGGNPANFGTFGTTGVTTINSGTATSNGTGLVNAIVAQGARVVLNSGTAINSNAGGTGGTAIFVNAGTGGALVNATRTEALGQGQAALQVFSNGAVDVTSGAIRTTQNSDGLSIQTGTDVVVRSTAIVTEGPGGARGLVLGGNSGGGGFNGGPNGFSYTSANVTSGSISTVGNGAFGIYATPNGAGSTTITSGAITTTGANATGILVTAIGTGVIGGPVTINSTGRLSTSGQNALGIDVVGGTGAVAVNNGGTVAVAGSSVDGIRVRNGTGATTIASNRIDLGTGNGINVSADGAVSIASGTIARTTNLSGAAILVGPNTFGATSATVTSDTITGGSRGIDVSSAGNLSITSGTMALTTAAGNTPTSLSGIGISAIGNGVLTINSGSVGFAGTGNTVGITAQNLSTTGGTMTINSRDVSVIGNGGYGILASTPGAAISINSSGAVATTGTVRQAGGQTGIASSRFADGIGAYNQSGSVDIVNSGTISTLGNAARGISVETGRAIQSFGAPATTASTAAINITNSGSITTRGGNVRIGNAFFGATGISVLADSNPVTIVSNAVTTLGGGSSGIEVRAGAGVASTGPVTIDSTSIATSGGGNMLGIIVGGHNGLTIRSGSIVTNATGLATGINVSAAATATGATSITSELIDIRNTAGGSSGMVVSQAGSGATVINSGVILNASGGAGIGIQGSRAGTGDVTINSRDITLLGAPTTAFRNAISIIPNAGNLLINSTGAIRSNGAGIQVQEQGQGLATGTVNISSNVIDAFQSAIAVNSGSAVTIAAATTSTSGNNQAAIQIGSPVTGPVTINAGTLTTTGAGALGVNVSTNTAGATAIAVGTANTTGSAVDARTAGAITLTSGTARVAGGTATGLTAISSGGDVTVTSTDLGVSNGIGIFAQGRDNATVTSGTLATTGAQTALFAQTSFGANAGTANGVVTVNSTNLTSEAAGINAAGPRATVIVNSDTLTSGNSRGIGAFGIDSTVNSRLLTSQGSGIFASFDNTGAQLGASTINSGAVTINGATDQFSFAIEANNRSATITSGTIVATGLGNRAGIGAQAVGGTAAPGDVLINSGSITTVGNGAYGIQAIASAGAVTINSTGAITTTGTTRIAGNGQPRYSAGIIAVAPNGPIAVTSNDISTTGAQSDGVRVEAGSGIVSYGQGTIGVAPIAVTTTGLTRTAGANAAGVNVLGGGGAVTVANTGTIATAGDGSAGIAVAAGEGTAAVSSNIVSTTGANAAGIRVAATTGAIGVTAANTTATGAGATAIDARSAGGAVTVTSTAASATAGTAILARAGGLATVNASTASGGGDGASGVSAVGGTGVALNIGSASSTGTAVTDANGVTTRADAIFAEATAGAIDATIGSASATGAGADAIRLVANGAGGAVTARITGIVTSAGGNALFIDPPGAVNVTVAAGARLTGALNGINTEGGSNAIVNAGTISSTGGAAIVAAGPTSIDNSGTIAGVGGTAVQLGAANDVVTLRTGSAVTGAIVGGGGTDGAILIGAGSVPIATQTVAGFTGFDSLTVRSGYWTAPAATNTTVSRTIIDNGAALELQNGATGIAGFSTGTIVDNGSLVVRSSATSAGSTFGATTVTGTGGVTFTGAGTTTLNGTNSLANTGTNLVEGGTVLVTGTQGGSFATGPAGTFRIGAGGTTGNFTGNLLNNGTLIVDRSDDSAFGGALTGAGLFVKEGAGRISFGTGYAFTGTTQLNGGAIRLSGPVAATTELDLRGNGQIDFSGTNQTIAELRGDSAAASVNIAGGSLTVNQATSTVFAGAIVGAGSLTKAGAGTLNLTGTNTYAGPTAINGGRLLVNGSIASAVTVNAGGTLGGTGRVGGTSVASGGTWAPGNSIGTQTVAGNIAFAAGSTYQVEANAGGASDRINASGNATLSGGTVQVLAEAGTYARQTNYTILTAAGGVTGRFANVTSNFAFLSPFLGYGGNAVTLTLARNDLAFGALATTGNQLATADALFGRGANDLLFNNILFQSTTNAPVVFDELGGELNAALPTELADNGRRIREAVLGRTSASGGGLGIWAQGLQSNARSDVGAGRARIRSNRTGVVGGIDYAAGGIRVGAFGGYQDDDVVMSRRSSRAAVKTSFGGVDAAFASGGLSIKAGGLYAEHEVDTARGLAASGLGAVTASFDARSVQVFGELGYALTQGPAVVTPFLRNAYTWTRVKAFTEVGSAAALSVARDRREVGLASAGLRVDGTTTLAGATLRPHVSIAYERGYGDLRGEAVQRFAGTGSAFTVSGAGLGKNNLTAEGGFDLQLDRFSIGAGGFASTSTRWSDYGGKATLSFRF